MFTMPATTAASPLLPYRDTHNHTIRYIPTTSGAYIPLPLSGYDSDFEPLITYTPPNELDENDMLHFTATGRPMPVVDDGVFKGMSGDMNCVPHLLPKRYTDESIIPAIIVDYTPRSNQGLDGEGTTNPDAKDGRGRRKSLMRKITGKEKDKGLLKVVYMPRGEYLKFFARGLKGEYVGTEPFRRWREEELEERYGMFKPVVPVGRRGYRPRV